MSNLSTICGSLFTHLPAPNFSNIWARPEMALPPFVADPTLQQTLHSEPLRPCKVSLKGEPRYRLIAQHAVFYGRLRSQLQGGSF